MISIDTNIIVRVFIDDLDIEQVKIARNLVSKAKQVYLAQIVLVEMVWVLTRTYKLSKPQIIMILQEIYENAAFVLDDKDIFQQEVFHSNYLDQ